MTNNKLTDPEVVELRMRLKNALNFYRQRPEPEAAKMVNMLMLADCAVEELQACKALQMNRQPTVFIPSIWKHYSGAKVAGVYENAMDKAGVKWLSVDDIRREGC